VREPPRPGFARRQRELHGRRGGSRPRSRPALGEDFLDWARGQGYRGAQFNAVVETNTAAVALWRSLGFEVVGTVPDAFRNPQAGYVGMYVGMYVGIHVMHRRL
jgi:L-amino acid N-acyltransferase YncA